MVHSRSPALARFVIPVLFAAAGTVAGAPAATAASAAVDYVALGDSYSAGVGTSREAGSCGRSPDGYPSLWAANHPTATLRFAACGGAVTDDVRTSQLSSVDSGTDLVSITIGGNDAGFFPTVMLCSTSSDAVCEQQVGAARTGMAQLLPGKLDATYQAIRRQAPNATVVVLGYPRLFDPTADCPGDGMTTFRRQILNAAADNLARVIADRARAAGFTYADVRDAYTGHASCTPGAWINSLTGTRLSDSFHPNAAGYAQGYLPALSAATAALG